MWNYIILPFLKYIVAPLGCILLALVGFAIWTVAKILCIGWWPILQSIFVLYTVVYILFTFNGRRGISWFSRRQNYKKHDDFLKDVDAFSPIRISDVTHVILDTSLYSEIYHDTMEWLSSAVKRRKTVEQTT